MKPFAVFIVAHAWDDDQIFLAGTTRPDGSIGLPGGKVDQGESPVQAALREAAEEGWEIDEISHSPIHVAEVDGNVVHWFVATAAPMMSTEWKEKDRGINPIWLSVSEAAHSGFGNGFLSQVEFDLSREFHL